jgi:hypothetical protein
MIEYGVRHGEVRCSQGATQHQLVRTKLLEAYRLAWTHTLTSKVLLETSAEPLSTFTELSKTVRLDMLAELYYCNKSQS